MDKPYRSGRACSRCLLVEADMAQLCRLCLDEMRDHAPLAAALARVAEARAIRGDAA